MALIVRQLDASPKRASPRPPRTTKAELEAKLASARAEIDTLTAARAKPTRGQMAIALWLPVFAAGVAWLAGDLQAQATVSGWWGFGLEALCAVALAVNVPHVARGAHLVTRCGMPSAVAISVMSDIGAMALIATIHHAPPTTLFGMIVAYGFSATMVGVSAYLNVVGFTDATP